MNMVEQQQYIPAGLPHTGNLAGSHGLSEARSIAPAGTSAYPEVAPFSAVSSFNIPAPCDSSLLTPISTTSSPPLHQIRKLAPQYPPPPSTPYTQVPTPPGSSKMYHQPWNNQFDMHNQNAPNGSPMNSQVPVPSEFYIPNEDRRTPNPPTEPYYGSFSVSEGPDTQSMHNQGPPSYYVPMEMGNQNSMMIREPRHLPVEPHPRDVSHPAASLLVQSHPSHSYNVRRASTDDRSYTSRADTVRRSSSGSPRRRSATQGSTRVNKKSRSSKRGGGSLRSQADPSDEHKNCYGQEIPPPIKKGCPEEERCIFESRWKHRSQRGQDMWDSIQADFEKKFNKKHGKEMLQMKFKRGRAKFYDWLPEDIRILQAAFKMVEKERYQYILERFHEMGGSRNMLLSASDIEIKIVNELKWEEAMYIDGLDDCIRRRRQTIVKKRSTGRGEPGGDVPVSDDMLRISQTPHNEDDVINQVYGRQDRWDEDMASVNGEMMDSTNLWENRAPMKIEPDTLVSSGGEHMARVHSNTNGHPIGIRPVPVYHPAPKAP